MRFGKELKQRLAVKIARLVSKSDVSISFRGSLLSKCVIKEEHKAVIQNYDLKNCNPSNIIQGFKKNGLLTGLGNRRIIENSEIGDYQQLEPFQELNGKFLKIIGINLLNSTNKQFIGALCENKHEHVAKFIVTAGCGSDERLLWRELGRVIHDIFCLEKFIDHKKCGFSESEVELGGRDSMIASDRAMMTKSIDFAKIELNVNFGGYHSSYSHPFSLHTDFDLDRNVQERISISTSDNRLSKVLLLRDMMEKSFDDKIKNRMWNEEDIVISFHSGDFKNCSQYLISCVRSAKELKTGIIGTDDTVHPVNNESTGLDMHHGFSISHLPRETDSMWNIRFFEQCGNKISDAAVHPKECLNPNELKKELLPRMMDCQSNTTSWLNLTSSTSTTRILNFCRSTLRLSISHITQLGLKSCFIYAWLFLVMFPLMPASTAEKIVNAQHLSVMKGQSVRIPCSVNRPVPVKWWHEYVGTGDPNYVYYAGLGLMGQYNSGGRHSIEDGTNHLMIKNVTDSDAGKYTCEDNEMEEPVDVYDVVILKSMPSCSSNVDLADVIGENDCGIDPDLLRLQCSVVYHGNFAPALQWQNSGGKHAMIGTNVSTLIRDETDHTSESTLTVTANMRLNNTYFTCQVADSQSDGIVSECKTENLIVHSLHNSSVALEINMKSEKEISCTANSSQPCHYQWTHQNQKYRIHILGSTLNFPDVTFRDGIYECQAECLLREKKCLTMPLRITVIADGTVGDSVSVILISVIGVLLMISIIQTFVLGWKCVGSRNNKDLRTDQFTSENYLLRSSNREDTDTVSVAVQVEDSDSDYLVDLRLPADEGIESQKSSLSMHSQSGIVDRSSIMNKEIIGSFESMGLE